MARRVDAGRAGDAVLGQADLILGWLSTQPPSAWRTPSALPGWTVAELATHLVTSQRNLGLVLARPVGDRPMTLDRYVAGYADAAGQILEREIAGAAGREPAEILADLYAATDAARAAVADLPTARAVAGPRGPLSPADWLLTRAVELVVHADDLSRSLPDRPPVELDRIALRGAEPGPFAG